jgi:ComF family protein
LTVGRADPVPEVLDEADGAGETDSALRPSGVRSGWARTWTDRLHGGLLPPRCVLCLDPGRAPALDLCPACEAELPVLGPPCEAPPFARVVAPFRYAWPVDALIRGFKYHGQLPHGRVLGTLLAEAVLACGTPLPQLIVPVPLHPARERERGYNQAWELARVAGRRLDVPIAPTLCARTRATPPQASLDAAARRANLAGAFAVTRPPGARHVALVDDVLTTGATVAAVAAALLGAGVTRVDCWTVARASGAPPE